MEEKFIEYAFTGNRANKTLKIADQNIEIPEPEVAAIWTIVDFKGDPALKNDEGIPTDPKFGFVADDLVFEFTRLDADGLPLPNLSVVFKDWAVTKPDKEYWLKKLKEILEGTNVEVEQLDDFTFDTESLELEEIEEQEIEETETEQVQLTDVQVAALPAVLAVEAIPPVAVTPLAVVGDQVQLPTALNVNTVPDQNDASVSAENLAFNVQRVLDIINGEQFDPDDDTSVNGPNGPAGIDGNGNLSPEAVAALHNAGVDSVLELARFNVYPAIPPTNNFEDTGDPPGGTFFANFLGQDNDGILGLGNEELLDQQINTSAEEGVAAWDGTATPPSVFFDSPTNGVVIFSSGFVDTPTVLNSPDSEFGPGPFYAELDRATGELVFSLPIEAPDDPDNPGTALRTLEEQLTILRNSIDELRDGEFLNVIFYYTAVPGQPQNRETAPIILRISGENDAPYENAGTEADPIYTFDTNGERAVLLNDPNDPNSGTDLAADDTDTAREGASIQGAAFGEVAGFTNKPDASVDALNNSPVAVQANDRASGVLGNDLNDTETILTDVQHPAFRYVAHAADLQSGDYLEFIAPAIFALEESDFSTAGDPNDVIRLFGFDNGFDTGILGGDESQNGTDLLNDLPSTSLFEINNWAYSPLFGDLNDPSANPEGVVLQPGEVIDPRNSSFQANEADLMGFDNGTFLYVFGRYGVLRVDNQGEWDYVRLFASGFADETMVEDPGSATPGPLTDQFVIQLFDVGDVNDPGDGAISLDGERHLVTIDISGVDINTSIFTIEDFNTLVGGVDPGLTHVSSRDPGLTGASDEIPDGHVPFNITEVFADTDGDGDVDGNDTQNPVDSHPNAYDESATITIDGAYGTLVINKATGSYTYTPDNANPTVNALANDGGTRETIVDTFEYIVADENPNDPFYQLDVDGTPGPDHPINYDRATLAITIEGANDSPRLDDANSVAHLAGDHETHLANPANFVDTNEEQDVTVTTAMLNEADPDDDGAEVTYTLTGPPTDGVLLTGGSPLGLNDTFTQADIDAGDIVYRPNPGPSASPADPGNEFAGTPNINRNTSDGSRYFEEDSFQVRMSDGGEDGAVPLDGVELDIRIGAVNDEPVITGSGVNDNFVEGAIPTTIFSNVVVDVIETDDLVKSLTLDVTGVQDASHEVVRFAAGDLVLEAGNSLAIGTGTASVVAGGAPGEFTIEIVFSGGVLSPGGDRGISETDVSSLLNSLQYLNISDDPTVAEARSFTLTELVDTGGNGVIDVDPNPGDDTYEIDADAPAITASIIVTPVNDAPTASVTPVSGTFADEGVGDLSVGELLVGDEVSAATGATINADVYTPFQGADILTMADGLIDGTRFDHDGAGTHGDASERIFAGQGQPQVDQQIQNITLEVSGVLDGTQELIRIEGVDIPLVGGGPAVAAGAVQVTITGVGTLQISIDGTITVADAESLVDGIGYRHTSDDPQDGDRTITLVSVQDNGGTDDGGVDTVLVNAAATINIDPVNDEPLVSAVGIDSPYDEGDAPVDLFSTVSINPIEAADGIEHISFHATRTGGSWDVGEVMSIGGLDVPLVAGSAVSDAAISVSVVDAGGGDFDVLVDLLAGSQTPAEAQALIDGITYRSDNVTDPTAGIREFTLTSVRDTEATPNGDDLWEGAIAATVTGNPLNDEPVVAGVGETPNFIEGGPAVDLFSGVSLDPVEMADGIEHISFHAVPVGGAFDEGEVLTLGGLDVVLEAGAAISDAAISVTVVDAGGGELDVLVDLLAGSQTRAEAEALVDGATYRNDSHDPTSGSRDITLTSVRDTETSPNGDDLWEGAITATVTDTPVNDAPTVAVTPVSGTFADEGGGDVSVGELLVGEEVAAATGGAADPDVFSPFQGADILTMADGLLDGTLFDHDGAGSHSEVSERVFTAQGQPQPEQQVLNITFEVAGVLDVGHELIRIEGVDIPLVAGGPTAAGSVQVTVSGVGPLVVSIDGPISVADAESLVDGIGYRHTSDDPTDGDRTITLVSLQDDGGTADGGVDTVVINSSATINIDPVNDEPVVDAVGGGVNFVEGGPPVDLFSTVSIDPIEATDGVEQISFHAVPVGGAFDSGEVLTIDGLDVALVDGTAVSNAAISVDVVDAGGGELDVVVDLLAGNQTAADAEALIDGATYRNDNADPTSGSRQITLASVRDTESTPNGDDLWEGAITATVSGGPINDEPVVNATGASATVDEGVSLDLFSGVSIDPIEASDGIEHISFHAVPAGGSFDVGEVLTIGGLELALTAGAAAADAAISVTVVDAGGGELDVLVDLLAGSQTPAEAQALVDGIAYRNDSESMTAGAREIALTSVRDTESTPNGDDLWEGVIPARATAGNQVNDEPIVAATGATTDFTEGGAAVDLFSGVSVDPVEPTDGIEHISFHAAPVSGAFDVGEVLTIGGLDVALSAGAAVSDAAISVTVVAAGGGELNVLVDLLAGSQTPAEAEALIDGATYRNENDDPTEGTRDITLTSVRDTESTPNGDDLWEGAINAAVTGSGINDEPVVAATGAMASFDEGGAAVNLFSAASIDAIEAADGIEHISFHAVPAGGAAFGSGEVLTIGGLDVALSAGAAVSDAAISVTVVDAGGGELDVLVDLLAGSQTTAEADGLINGMTYRNDSDDPRSGSRGIALTSVRDTETTPNGDDLWEGSIPATVTSNPINDEPVVAATGEAANFTEGDLSAVDLFSTVSIDPIEAADGIEFINFRVTPPAGGFDSGEVLVIGGLDVALSIGASASDAAISVNVIDAGGGALDVQVDLLAGNQTPADAQALVDGAGYRNDTQSVTAGERQISLTEVRDTEATPNGDDLWEGTISATVTVDAVPQNSAPVFSDPTPNTDAVYNHMTSKVVINPDLTVLDTELAAASGDNGNSTSGNYDGATLRLERDGGGFSIDRFSFDFGSGDQVTSTGGDFAESDFHVVTDGANNYIAFDQPTMGTNNIAVFAQIISPIMGDGLDAFSETFLEILFLDNNPVITPFNDQTPGSAIAGEDIGAIPAGQELVNVVLQSITYENSSQSNGTVDDLRFNFTLNDGNTGDQGAGGDLEGTAATQIDVINQVPPIAIDLDGDGVEFVTAAEANANLDFNGDGVADPSAWVGNDDGLIAVDANRDGQITDRSEVVFTDLAEGDTDFEAFLNAFDDNDDGIIDSSDAVYEYAGVWSDLNGDGTFGSDEFRTLDEMGIQSLDLNGSGAPYVTAEGQVLVHAEGSFVRTDGSEGQLADASFAQGTGALPPADEVIAGGDVPLDGAAAESEDGSLANGGGGQVAADDLGVAETANAVEDAALDAPAAVA